MPVNISNLIDALVEISKEKNLRAAASESLKGGLVAGTSAALGGLLLGPLGLALGGAVGGALATYSSHGKFRPVAGIIRDMSSDQKQLLCSKVKKAFSEIGYNDVTTIVMLILSAANFKELALQEVTNFLSKEMNLQIRL